MMWMILQLRVLSNFKQTITLDPLKKESYSPTKHLLQLLILAVQGCWKWLIPNMVFLLCYCLQSENSIYRSKDCKNKLELNVGYGHHTGQSLSNRVER